MHHAIRSDHALHMLKSLEERGKEDAPVHITEAGWEEYANHPDEAVRTAARSSKFCPDKYRY